MNATGLNTGICCLALSSLLGNKVSFPGTSAYESSIASYFSQQNANLHPLCIVSPTTAKDVSVAITSLTTSDAVDANFHFAIRSGGHTSFSGASNIANGVTIDLRHLDTIIVSDDRKTVSVGAGATWGEVYSFLDPLGLSLAGGRAAQVGVGGLTVGGGISYFSPRYGWTCDTVSSFEIVLANGTVVEVSEGTDPDLMRALRGGGSNFGIVTSVRLRTFEQGPVWGGVVFYPLDTAEEQIRAFAELSSAEEYDDYASLITSFGFAGGERAAVVVNTIVYTKAEEYPAVFEPFFKLPLLSSTMRIAEMHEMSTEQGSYSPNGKRQLSVEMTLVSTIPSLNATYLRWNSSLAAIQDVPGIGWSLSLEPLPPSIYARATGNAMGLSERSESLVIVLLSATWDDAADDAKVEETARVLVAGIEDDARRLHAYNPFVYLNYAAKWQDPIATYGKESVEKLRRVSQEVDPRGVFRYNMPGGFKIPI